jgi:O-antigen/teichoic acid export membrane protein
MDNISVKGAFWSMVERFSTVGIQMLCMLVIAQFLKPSEFGLISMMTIFMAFSAILIDSGFGQALIREQDVTQEDYSSVFFFNIMLGIFIYVAAFFAAPAIAAFYEEPQLTELVRVSFLALVLQSFTVVQQAQLFKNVEFNKVFRISLVSVVISGIIGIAVSVLYRNVWGLIAQSISFAIIRTSLFWIVNRWRPSMTFEWKSIKKYLKFSANVLGSHLLAAIADNMANLFIGKAYSSTVLGNYSVPNKIQTTISGTTSYSIHRVSYSVMSTFQEDAERLRQYSQKVVGMAFYIIAPIMLFLLIEAEDFFNILLSPEWKEAAHYFKYLCVIGGIFCFADINMDVLLVKNRSDMVFRIEFIRKVLLVVALCIGIRYEMETLLIILVAYNVFNALFVSYYAGREIELGLFSQTKAILPTAICLLIMGTLSYYISQVNIDYRIRLITNLLAAIMVYSFIAYLMKIPYHKYLIETVKSFIGLLKQ